MSVLTSFTIVRVLCGVSILKHVSSVAVIVDGNNDDDEC